MILFSTLEKFFETKNNGLTKIKADDTPVTNGDIEVNKILTNKLKELTPQIIISEETSDNKMIQDLKDFWLVDPIMALMII